MKKVFLTAFILSFWVFTAQGADLKIGYVDLNKALNESDKGGKATEILENMLNSKKAIITKKEAEINELRKELEKQASILTPESRRDKEDHLNKLIRDVQRMVNDFQEEFQKKEAGLRLEILKDLSGIVNKIGEEEDYTVIFESGTSSILYSQKKFDITEKVIKKYNETTKTNED